MTDQDELLKEIGMAVSVVLMGMSIMHEESDRKAMAVACDKRLRRLRKLCDSMDKKICDHALLTQRTPGSPYVCIKCGHTQ